MYLFILGRQPEIGTAELRAVFGNAELILPNIALVKADTPPDINCLGGTRKLGQVIYDNDVIAKPATKAEAIQYIGRSARLLRSARNDASDDFLIDHFQNLPPGKITLGVSQYGKTASAAGARKTGISIKKQLDRSVRVLPNSTAEIADAATLGNGLGTKPTKVELLMVSAGRRLIIAELTGVQNLNAYTLRDRGRPKRDARVGMLPPKLAQVMINLACSSIPSLRGLRHGPKHSSATILDPFCGTGVVLQEALLMGYSVYGTDKEPRMIEYSKANLNWLSSLQGLRLGPSATSPGSRRSARDDVRLEPADATNHTWRPPIGAVVTEVYLGQPYSTTPPMEKLKENINTCNTIIEKFLSNISPQLKPGTPLCLAVPAWFIDGKTYHLPILSYSELDSKSMRLILPEFRVKPGMTSRPLIYRREGQVVGRELLVLIKNS